MKDKCSICGCTYEIFTFKSGCVCEACLDFLKDFTPDSEVRSDENETP